jgi:hypothetical protein
VLLVAVLTRFQFCAGHHRKYTSNLYRAFDSERNSHEIVSELFVILAHLTIESVAPTWSYSETWLIDANVESVVANPLVAFGDIREQVEK